MGKTKTQDQWRDPNSLVEVRHPDIEAQTVPYAQALRMMAHPGGAKFWIEGEAQPEQVIESHANNETGPDAA